MHNTRYIVIFVAILTSVVALVLSLLATGLKPIHERNEAIYNKKGILTAIETHLGQPVKEMTDDQIQEIFDNQITQEVIDMEGNAMSGIMAEDIKMRDEKKKPLQDRQLPVYIFNGKEKLYIVSVRGNGLWDEIWGSVALEGDFVTVAGATFDHQGETPGLGAEIKDNPGFSKQFIGKKIYDDRGDYTSITVMKGPIKVADHQVDGISGATITCNGVSDMLQEGIKYYEPYFNKSKLSSTTQN